MEVVPPGRAQARFMEQWEVFRSAYAREGLKDEAKAAFEQALEGKWDGGLGNQPVRALVLVGWAEQSEARGDVNAATYLLEGAQKLAPRSVRLELALARYYLGGGRFEPLKSLSHFRRAAADLSEDFPELFRFLGRLCMVPLVFLWLFGLVIGLILILRYAPLLAHDLSDFFPPEKIPAGLTWALTGVLLLLPLAAGLSVWWLLGWWLVIFSLYMSGGERAAAYLWLILLLGSPWLTEKYALFSAARADEALQAVLRVRGGAPTAEDVQLLKEAHDQDPEDLLIGFSLAQLLQREGRFNEALAAYADSLASDRTDQAAYNNVAEIYFAAGDVRSAFQALSRAREEEPTKVEILFNLSQYYKQSGQEPEMNEQLGNAQDLDADRVKELQDKAGVNRLNRILAGLPAPGALVWARALQRSPEKIALVERTQNLWLGPPGELGVYAGDLVFLVILTVIGLGKKRWRLAVRCASCGQAICLRCQRPAKDPAVCGPCYNVFKGQGGVDLKIKMQKRAQVQQYRDRWRRAALALSALLPGTGLLLLGNAAAGFALLVLAALPLSGMLSAYLLWPDPGPFYAGGTSAGAVLLAFIYFALMIVSIFLCRAEADHWR